MTTASGAVRVVHLVLLAAVIVVGVVVWLLLPGARDDRVAPGDPATAHASPEIQAPPAGDRPATAPAIAPRAFSESEPAEGAADVLVGLALDPGDADVGDQLLDGPAMLVDSRRLDPQEAPEPMVVTAGVGQHLGEVVDDLRLTAA